MTKIIFNDPPENALECPYYRAGYCKLVFAGMCTFDIGNKCKLEEETC